MNKVSKNSAATLFFLVLILVGLFFSKPIADIAGGLFSIIFDVPSGYFGHAFEGVEIPIPSHPEISTQVEGEWSDAGTEYKARGEQWTVWLDDTALQNIGQEGDVRWYIIPLTVADTATLYDEHDGVNGVTYLGLFSQKGDGKMIYHNALLIAEHTRIEKTPDPSSEDIATVDSSGTLVSTFKNTSTAVRSRISYKREGEKLSEVKREILP